jgi:hypothetical protein
MKSPHRDRVGYTTCCLGFGHLLIDSVLSNKQSLILGHSKSDWDTPTELINHPEGLQRCLCPALEAIGVPGGGSSPAGDSNWSRRGCEVEFLAPVRDEQNKKLESLEVKV